MGIFKSLARLQDLWDNDKNVSPKISKQLTTSWSQSMAIRPNDHKFHN